MAIHSVFLPGQSHGQRSLVGYSPWGHKESDTTEQLTQLICICSSFCFPWVVFLHKMLSVFSYIYLPSIYLLWWGVHIFCPLIIGLYVSLLLSFGSSFYILDTGSLYVFCRYFLQVWLSFHFFQTISFTEHTFLNSVV